MKVSRQPHCHRSCLHPHWRESAFSLYEVIVCLIVLSILSVIAIPGFQQLIASQRITGAVNDLVTALHLARSEAIKRKEQAVLCPSVNGQLCLSPVAGSTAWDTGYLLFIDRNGNHAMDADETIVRIFDASEDLTIRSTAGRSQVSYYPNGLTPGSNLTITFCDKYGRVKPRAVILSNYGRARTSTRAADGSAILCPETV